MRIGPDPLTTETVVKGTTALGELVEPATGTGGADTGASGGNRNWGPWQSYAIEHVDDTALPGQYVWRCEFNGDNNNARTAVKNRGISWLLDD